MIGRTRKENHVGSGREVRPGGVDIAGECGRAVSRCEPFFVFQIGADDQSSSHRMATGGSECGTGRQGCAAHVVAVVGHV